MRTIVRRMAGVFLVITVALLSGCQGRVFTRQDITYPPGSKLHLKNWSYAMTVTVSSTRRPPQKAAKQVEIEVRDSSNRKLLTDHLEFDAASVDATASWQESSTISLHLLEVGNKYASDPYNAALLRSGPKKLADLRYEFDRSSGRYERVR